MKAKIKNVKTGLNKTLTVSDLSGGLNKKGSVFDIRDNEAIGLVNFVFTEDGILRVRPGYIKYNDTKLSGAINSLFRYYKKDGSTAYFICTSGTSIYSGSSGAWTTLTSNVTLTTGLRFRFAVFNDYLFMTNGSNKPLVWDGTNNVRQIGIVAPTSAPSLTEGSTGNPSGTYYYKVTYYNSTDSIESAPSSASNPITVSSKKIELSSIPQSDDAQVDYIYIYRTQDGGSTYYYVASIADGTTTYTDNNSDATIGANATLGSTNYLPPPTNADYIAISHRRLYFANNSSYPSRLYYSEIDTPEYFPATNYRDISPDDGDWITGILAWNDYLYIFKQNGTYVLTDPADPANSILREISRDIGIIAPDTLTTGQFQRPVGVNDWVLVPGIIGYTRFGVQGFDGQQWHPLSERVEPILEELYEVNKKYMTGFFNKGKYYLAYQPEKGNAIDGGFVTYDQSTTDSGNENKDATYSTDHGVDSYSDTYDARIDLSNTSTSYDKEIKVKIYVDWQKYTDLEYEWIYNNSPSYEIFFSKDSGSTWTSANKTSAVFKAISLKNVANKATYYFEHIFVDSSVTNVRLDYFATKYSYLPRPNYIRLVSVQYFYEYSSAVTGSDVKNSRMLYYDSLHNAWSEIWGINANCFCAFNGQNDQGEEYFGSSKLGYVYRMNIGSDDDGNDIFALYHSKHYDCGQRGIKKRFQQLTINTNVFPSELNLDVFTDRVQRSYHKFNLLPEKANTKYWNEDHFGKVVFDRIINMVQKTFRLASNSLGRFISVKFWKSSKESLAIQDYSIKYVEREGYR